MSESEQNVRLQQIPDKPSLRLVDHTASDFYYLACALIGVMTLLVIGEKVLFLVSLVVAFVGWWRFDMGRGYYMFGSGHQNLYITLVKKGVIWRPTFIERRRKRLGKLLHKPPHAIRLGVTGVETGDTMLGLLSQPDNQTDNFVIVGDGSDLVAQEPYMQAAMTSDIAEEIKRIASEVDYPIGVSYVFRRRPYDLPGTNNYVLENYHPDIVVPEGAIKPMTELTAREQTNLRISEHQSQLREMVSLAAGEVTMAAVITVRRHQKWRQAAKKGRLTIDDIDQAPVAQMARQLAADFNSQRLVTNARALGLAETFRFVRQAWDVKKLPEYYRACYLGEIPGRDEEMDYDDRGDLASNPQAYPTEEIIAKNSYCIIDGTYHSTIRLVRCPEAALPSFFRSLHAINVQWKSVALVGETMSGNRQSLMLTYGISFSQAWDQTRRQSYKTPEQKRRRERLEEQHVEQYRSGSILQTYNILISVSGSSLEEIKNSREKVLSGIRAMSHTKGKIIRGANRQIAALLSATTGVNQL